MLYDRAQIDVEAGNGGDGCVSFRREAHVPRGGPDGGDGGRGGAVALVCDPALRDLRALRRKPRLRARRGGAGSAALRHGASGPELEVRVPPGTQARGSAGDLDGRAWDLVRAGQRVVIARGGAGGRGNKRFAGPTRQAPRFAERGLPGERGSLDLALKLLADVGLVGLPNAGKSSLLARLTRAAPKVAAYPFTTLEPVLGVLERDDRQLVIADIPGLIEGASQGAGLGDEFLAHVERTALLVHVLALEPDAPYGSLLDRYETIERELELYDPRLPALPRVLALSKADLVTTTAAAAVADELAGRLDLAVPIVVTSSATGHGLDRLARELLARVVADTAARAHVPVEAPPGAPGGQPGGLDAEAEGEEQLAEHMTFRPAATTGYAVERVGERAFAISGPVAETLVRRFDLGNDEARAYVITRLRRLGVLGALRSRGLRPGDEVTLAGEAIDLAAWVRSQT